MFAGSTAIFVIVATTGSEQSQLNLIFSLSVTAPNGEGVVVSRGGGVDVAVGEGIICVGLGLEFGVTVLEGELPIGLVGGLLMVVKVEMITPEISTTPSTDSITKSIFLPIILFFSNIVTTPPIIATKLAIIPT